MEKVVVSWSGGKDSALALHEALNTGRYEVKALLTTVTPDSRVGVHGVPLELLERQADALDLPLHLVRLPEKPSNQEYEVRVREALEPLAHRGVTGVVSGDIFLADVRAYRENLLESARMQGIFPLWGRDTAQLARTFLRSGFRAVICSVDSHALGASFAGRLYDEKFLVDLPGSADPCGENGEFHTFVFDGPTFSHAVRHTRGEVSLSDGRMYQCELLPD